MMEKNENFLGTRVSDKILKEIQEYCDHYKISKSRLLRNSIVYFMKLAQQDDNTYHPMMIFSKEELRYMFSCMNERQLKEFAAKSYEMGQKSKKHFFKNISPEDLDLKPTLRLLVKALVQEVFYFVGQNWFSNISHNFEGNKFNIAGSHKLNENFSTFFKFLMVNYLNDYNFTLVDEALEDNTVRLNFVKST